MEMTIVAFIFFALILVLLSDLSKYNAIRERIMSSASKTVDWKALTYCWYII